MASPLRRTLFIALCPTLLLAQMVAEDSAPAPAPLVEEGPDHAVVAPWLAPKLSTTWINFHGRDIYLSIQRDPAGVATIEYQVGHAGPIRVIPDGDARRLKVPHEVAIEVHVRDGEGRAEFRMEDAKGNPTGEAFSIRGMGKADGPRGERSFAPACPWSFVLS